METGDDKKRGSPCPECGGKDYKPKYNNNHNPEQLRVECTNCRHMFQLHPKRKPHRGGYKKAKVEEPAQYRVLIKRCDRCGEMNAKFYGLNNNDPLQPRYKCFNTMCKRVFTPFKKSRLKSQLGDGKRGASLSRDLHGGTLRSAQFASTSSTDSLDNHAFGFVMGTPVLDMNGGEVSSSRYAAHIAHMTLENTIHVSYDHDPVSTYMSITPMHSNVDLLMCAPPASHNHKHMLMDSGRVAWVHKDYNGLRHPPTNMLSGSIYQDWQETVIMGGHMNNIVIQSNNPRQLGNGGPM